MSAHAFKKTVSGKRILVNVRELVARHGDDWCKFAPKYFRHEPRPDRDDAVVMGLMERGMWPRVES